MKKGFTLLLMVLLSTTLNANEKQIKDFIKNYEAKVKPAYTKTTLAMFNAKISGKEADYKKSTKYQIELSKIFSNKKDYEKIKELRKQKIADTELKRELELIYNAYTSSQMEAKKLEEIIKIQNNIESNFSTFRAKVAGKELTDNQIENILKTSNNSKELQEAWESSKVVGAKVAEDIKKLVVLRNSASKDLGYSNFHEMMLSLGEQDPKEIEKLFDELDSLTAPAYKKLKKEMDVVLAKKYGIKPSDLKPWHYQNRFFQEAPSIYSVDLDSFYKDEDLVELTQRYFDSIDMNVEGITKRSDLYEKPGKYQHACCDNLDREQDIRVICNIKPNQNWMDTMLHEYGHAVYEQYLDPKLPWTFREPAHIFTTEAIAMLFGRMASNPKWIEDLVGINKDELNKIKDNSFKIQKLRQLVFSRWVQVMYRFEKSMYENPKQDLNKLWWTLVEKYQLVKKPEGRNEPDWASKIHVALAPAYYHNYLMGELLASQLHYYITKNIIKSNDVKMQSYYKNKKVGNYLKEKVFAPGRRLYWNDMIKKATGERLTAKYYAKQFVN